MTDVRQANITGIRKSRIDRGTNYINNRFLEIEAISKGIEAQIDPFSTISKVTTQRTVEIARQIGIDEVEIQQWLKVREERASIKYELVKLIMNSDGGQNLVGPELREGLGLIRTQELLAARRVDGSSQFFTRANDFGYSKTAKETLKIWDKDKVLQDVVWTIRKFRPDVNFSGWLIRSSSGSRNSIILP